MLETDKVDYKSAASAPSLAVPPDLSQLSRDNRYAIPGAPVTASSYQIGQATQALPVALNTLSATCASNVPATSAGWSSSGRPTNCGIRSRTSGRKTVSCCRWTRSNLGIMETDWAENRAKIPQDFIRQSLGKLLDSLYSTAERDKLPHPARAQRLLAKPRSTSATAA
jgi:outer membrane protein assembly factor BamC